jgi:protein-L-isoaspartate O-methyltransferase
VVVITISHDQFGGWEKYQTAEEMKINRKYEYDPEFVPLICKWLGLSPRHPSVVIDVGCGSGYFTKIIAQCISEKGKVIGIDPDRKLVKEAEKICKRKHISSIHYELATSFRLVGFLPS